MTAEQWLAKIADLVRAHTEQLLAREITVSDADHEEQELVLRARLDLTDEEGRELLKQILAFHQALASELAQKGHPVSGNDPKKPN
jgi:hypothetical protein